MKLRQLFENKRTAVMAFGRMNPPTIGHQKLVEAIKSHNGDHYVFLSQSQKPKTDPLSFTDKLRYAKFFFPEVSIGHPQVRTIIQALQKISDLGYEDLIYVAGSDRVQAFEELINKYNGKDYNFKSIKVVSAGERDPDADGAEGMSASKMRQAAADGNLEAFTEGTPRPELAEEMFAAVRQGMGIRDEEPAENIAEQDVNKAYKTYVQLKRFENQMAVSKASSDYTMSLGDSSQKLKADIAKLEKKYPQFIKMYADRVQKSKASMAQASTGLAQRIKDFDESIGSDINFPGFDSEEEKKKKKKKQSLLDKLKAAMGVSEDVSPEDEDKFHNELDDLVHKYFGDSPDEEKMKKKMRKVKEGDLVVDRASLRTYLKQMIDDAIDQEEDIEKLSKVLKMLVGKEIKSRGQRFAITAEDIVYTLEACKNKRKKMRKAD